jgi:hypothetical protein
MPPALLVVAGSGRSGTSLFTGLCGRLGFRIPQPEVQADSSNPHGFGEPRWAVDFHEQLLKSLDVTREDARPSAWEAAARVTERPRARERLRTWLEEQFDGADRVVVKDPRLTWFLELWQDVAGELGAETHVATMLRHPAASIKSRELAYGAGSSHATRTAGWINMMLFTEQRTRGMSRALIRYDDLLADWRGTFTAAETSLGLPLTSSATPEQLAAADDLVDPKLRRAEPDWDELGLPDDLRDLAESAYTALSGFGVGTAEAAGDQAGLTARADEVRERYTGYYATAESVARSSIAAARAKERRAVTKAMEAEREEAATTPWARARRAAGRARRKVSRR